MKTFRMVWGLGLETIQLGVVGIRWMIHLVLESGSEQLLWESDNEFARMNLAGR